VFCLFMFTKCKQTIIQTKQTYYTIPSTCPDVPTKFQIKRTWNGGENSSFLKPRFSRFRLFVVCLFVCLLFCLFTFQNRQKNGQKSTKNQTFCHFILFPCSWRSSWGHVGVKMVSSPGTPGSWLTLGLPLGHIFSICWCFFGVFLSFYRSSFWRGSALHFERILG